VNIVTYLHCASPKFCAALLLCLLVGCADDSSEGSSSSAETSDASKSDSKAAKAGNAKTGDSSSSDSNKGSGGSGGGAAKSAKQSTKKASDTDHDAGPEKHAATAMRDEDAGTHQAGAPSGKDAQDGQMKDGQMKDGQMKDGQMMGSMMPSSIGSCCSPHESRGCDNPDIEACVCDKLKSCCTEAWTQACAFIVTTKYCQAGVRDCVCGSADGQWQQKSCCDVEWTDTCNTVAEAKCGATKGCN
jgi:hypothetical protein